MPRCLWCSLVLLVTLSASPTTWAGGPGSEVGFIRGDVDGSGTFELLDAVRLLNHLFPPAIPPADGDFVALCRDAADFNDDDILFLDDVISLLAFLFTDGGPPASPYPTCGLDPTTSPDELGCDVYPHCDGFTGADLAGHLLRRLAHGVTPSELIRVQDIGAGAYIEEQLDPASIDESGNTRLNTLLAGLEPDFQFSDLYRLQFARGLYSARQLQETLTDFWDNHFNTRLFTVRNHFNSLPIYNSTTSLQVATFHEHAENQGFRDFALGSFQDLLEISATSVTMLIYLDNISNVAVNPNENYARELLELHTMGVDNGYTQTDVEQVARCFTGWTICFVDPTEADDPHAPCQPVVDGTDRVWAFHFDPMIHDYNPKTIFAGTTYELTIPARPPGSLEGIQDGFEVIAHLTGLSQTAEFVSTKLVQKLVADEAPPSLVIACINTWLNTGGDIREVVSTILHSDEFLHENRWNKVRTPTESILATVRAFDGDTGLQPVQNAIATLGHTPFNFSTPDGFPESGADQLGTAKLLERIRFTQLLDSASLDPDPAYDLVGILEDQLVPLEDVDAIVDFFLGLLYQSQVTDTDRQLAIDFLATDDDGVPVPLDSTAVDYESRIARVAIFIASFPQGLKQ